MYARFRLVDACAVILPLTMTGGLHAQEQERPPATLSNIIEPGKGRVLARWGETAEKVDAVLLHVIDRIRAARFAGNVVDYSQLGVPSLLRVGSDGLVQCYVVLSELTDANEQSLREQGMRVELADLDMKIVQGWIPPDELLAISQLPFVLQITPPDYGVIRCAGNACTQGDAIHKAPEVRTLGYDGTGVKVGVISDGVTSRNTSIASGDLPAQITIHPTQPGSGDEGTAMLEIIHDIAPGASLYFAGGLGGLPTSVEMVSAINWMRQQGVHVIVDDIGFFTEPYFQDGPVAIAVRDAVANGHVYCTAAGNECDKHYQGLYVDSDGTGPNNFHDFKLGSGTDDLLNVIVGPQQTLTVRLQWDDPFGQSANDYDIHLFDFQSLQYVGLAGQNVQDGNDDPVETAFYTNPGLGTREIGIEIRNFLGLAAPRTLELFFFNAIGNDDDVSCADSIFGHPAVADVISCAAINANSPGNHVAASYSSRGPSTIAHPAPVVRNTPFCSAIDLVDVTGAGGFTTPFRGTSAAAPHAAGLAAILLQATDLAATPADIRAALAAGALERGDIGFDYIYGHGLLDVAAALVHVCPPSTPSGVSATASSLCDRVELNWNPVIGAIKYTIWRSVEGDANSAAQIAEVTDMVATDYDAVPQTDYFYWVRAVKDCGISGFGVPAIGRRRGPPESVFDLQAGVATSCDYVEIAWGSAFQANDYTIWRAVSQEFAGASQLAHADSPFRDMTAQANVDYYYWVVAENSCGSAMPAGPVLGTRMGPAVAPGGLAVSDGEYCDRIAIRWDGVSAASGFTVLRNTRDERGGAESLGMVMADSDHMEFSDSDVESGIRYYYWVESEGQCGVGGSAGPVMGSVKALPISPTNVRAESAGDVIVVSWQGSAIPSSYSVWRATSDAVEGSRMLASTGSGPYEDRDAQMGIEYYYWVKAINECGESDFSKAVSAARTLAAPGMQGAPPCGVGACGGGALSSLLGVCSLAMLKRRRRRR